MSISISLEDIIQSIKPITDLNPLITNSSVYEKIKETAQKNESVPQDDTSEITVSDETRKEFSDMYCDNINAIWDQKKRDDKYMADTKTETKQVFTDIFTKGFEKLDNDDEYNTMSAYDKYLCRTIGKLFEQGLEYQAEIGKRTGEMTEGMVMLDVFHEIQGGNTYDDVYEKLGYMVNMMIGDRDKQNTLEQLVQSQTAYEYAKKNNIDLTANQVDSLYTIDSEEDLLTSLEEFKQENSEQQLNVADIDTSEDNDLEYDM